MRMWAKAGSKPALLEWLLSSGLRVPDTGSRRVWESMRRVRWPASVTAVSQPSRRTAVTCRRVSS